jgi:2-methylcitrate dehydratase PrpD
MGQQIETLARFVAETPADAVPAAVRSHAKLVLLDTLGVILAGSEQPEVRKARAGLAPTFGTGATILAHGWPSSDPRTAALLNGTAGRSIELCEGHRYVSCQGAVQVLPGVLAMAEHAGASGSEMLTALVVGYDAAIRVGSGLTARPIAHQNGQAAMIGAAAAGARLRGLDGKGTSLAMRIAATLVLTPSYTNAVAGATTLNVAGGMSGFAAGLAPELAAAGFVAQSDAIEEAFGQLVGDGYDPTHIVDELGSRWEITRNYFRLRACCNPIYAALDALEDGLAALKPRPEDIDSIEVATYRFASVMANPSPSNYFASKYSLPHAAAAVVVRGNAGYGSFTEAVLHDPLVSALRQRVRISEDPALSAMVPQLKPARVTVRLKDGRSSTNTCESARGDFQRPYGETEVREKFRELAGVVLTQAGVAAVEKAVDGCEAWTNLRPLLETLRQHTKA